MIKLLQIIALVAFFSGLNVFAQNDDKKDEKKKLDGKTILMVIAQEEYRDEELNTPKELFLKENAKITIACNSTKEAKGMLEGKTRPDIAIKDAKNEYDALVIVGGLGSKSYLWDNKELKSLVQKMNKDKKVIAAICLSPVVLARAAILKDKEATVYDTEETKSEFKKYKVIYKDKDVVVSDNIITANGPDASEDFAKEIVKALSETKK